MSHQRKTLLTPEEYLAIERKSEIKHEYFAGEMFAMVGASKRHNLITANIIRVLGNQLLDRPCNVYPSDMRVKVSATGKYTYPDVLLLAMKRSSMTRRMIRCLIRWLSSRSYRNPQKHMIGARNLNSIKTSNPLQIICL